MTHERRPEARDDARALGCSLADAARRTPLSQSGCPFRSEGLALATLIQWRFDLAAPLSRHGPIPVAHTSVSLANVRMLDRTAGRMSANVPQPSRDRIDDALTAQPRRTALHQGRPRPVRNGTRSRSTERNRAFDRFEHLGKLGTRRREAARKTTTVGSPDGTCPHSTSRCPSLMPSRAG